MNLIDTNGACQDVLVLLAEGFSKESIIPPPLCCTLTLMGVVCVQGLSNCTENNNTHNICDVCDVCIMCDMCVYTHSCRILVYQMSVLSTASSTEVFNLKGRGERGGKGGETGPLSS